MRVDHHIAAANTTIASTVPAALSYHPRQPNAEEDELLASQVFHSSPPPAPDDDDDEPLTYDALDGLDERGVASPPSTPIAEVDEEDMITAGIIDGTRGLPSLTSSVVKGEAANGLLDLSRSFGGA